ncbi:Uncharacterised protein [uncultured archaeon]|nr:Uncharacterised protein [uncultured archaeon]
MSNILSLSKNGFIFTMEAALSLLMLALMIAALPQPNSFSLKELVVTQQANDLLRVWSAKSTTEVEMIADTNKLLNGNAELWVNENKLLNGLMRKNSIATEGILLDEWLAEKKVKIVVYYD